MRHPWPGIPSGFPDPPPPTKAAGGAAPAGTPTLIGPFVVEVSDIPHDGDKHTLWTPEVGDVLLRLFPDWQNVTQWDSGALAFGQNVDATSPGHNILAFGGQGVIGMSNTGLSLDMDPMGATNNQTNATGGGVGVTGYVCHSTEPFQVQLTQTGGTDPTVGHVELYALVSKAVAP